MMFEIPTARSGGSTADLARPVARPRSAAFPTSLQRSLALWALGLALAAGQAVAQAPTAPRPDAATPAPEPQSIERPVPRDLWVEVVDGRGRARAGDDANLPEITVREGEAAPVTATPRVGVPVPRIVYLEPMLSSLGSLRRAADALTPLAEELTAGGEVWLVQAGIDDPPSTLVRTADPLVLGERLRRAALTESGLDSLVDLRRRTLEELARSAALPAAERASLIADAVREERELVLGRLERMVVWATDLATGPDASRGPRLLLPVFDGYDLDPLDRYLRGVDEETARLVLRQTVQGIDLDTRTRELARALAAVGWTVAPIALPADEEEQAAEFGALESGSEDQVTAFPGITIRPGQIFRRGDDDEDETEELVAEDDVRLEDPTAPLLRLAGATGGRLLAGDVALRDFVDRLGMRAVLRYPSRLDSARDIVPLVVQVARDGWSVEAPRWSAAGVPAALSGLRLGRVLAGLQGTFDVAAVLEVPGDPAAPSTIEARLDLFDLAGADPDDAAADEQTVDAARVGDLGAADLGIGDLLIGDLRITVEAQTEGGLRRLLQETLRDQDLTDGREWRFRRDLDLPSDATSVGVLVEELRSGRWGGRRATIVAAGGRAYLPTPKVVEIQKPEAALLRGRTRFEVSVFDSRVARVAFLLDEREVASARSEPWAARLDLGRTPRRQMLTTVAFDSAGQELGRDEAVLNGGDAALAVRITEPTVRRVTGLVEVAADISVPVERSLDRVLFFWNNEAVATLYAPPFRQRILVPAERPVGYVRVVALLDDGSLAEDVLFLNGPDAGERVEVQLVELYVVVADDEGRPVRDLRQTDFAVRADGRPRDIATFQDSSELPLTLGLAIDSSASMFVKLPRVQRAAENFLRTTFEAQDRAFVVDFDSEPRLARGTTGDIDRVVRAIYGLEASGRTALWESIVYSLVQLQSVRGRKALIVFSDGADEDDQFPFRSSMRIAREMGVPIYLILMREEPDDGLDLSLFSRSFTSRVDRLVDATGGRVYYAREYDDLTAVYEQIEQELRSQYLLAFYPDGEETLRGRRDVEVDVLRDDLEARLLSGAFE
ncbi:MAG: VWA domain-containing protein [Acidobacteriota bacterium]